MSPQKERILIVDDEVKILEVLKTLLEGSGYQVLQSASGEKALQIADSLHPDLIMLDVMLPDISGEQVCRTIRNRGQRIPVIMLTARVDEDFKVRCLDYGADDYVTKPFSPKELLGRVRAILRRCREDRQFLAEVMLFGEGDLEVNNVAHEVKVQGNLVNLTPIEYKLLTTLLSNAKRVFTREELIIAVLGYNYEGQERSIDTHIKNLRRKLGEHSSYQFIQTLHGVGYRFGGE